MTIEEKIKESILEHVAKGERSSSIRISSLMCQKFQVTVDIPFILLKQLETENKILRCDHIAGGWNENHHYEIPLCEEKRLVTNQTTT